MKFEIDPTASILAALQAEIRNACEPIVQAALKQAEVDVRERVARFAVKIAQQARLDFGGSQLRITVDFGKPKVLDI